ncbi:MAG: alcohol dehydrogenase catalytic domain-containing protein [Candidatus Hadarchaeum sp.]|uniref:alcohol dehydrogenase catalytic domain-containing protein n=1 Tax=Candidatus Hadarchaeum sp. TaxID=2883567 RepID=UPI003176550A
MLKGNMLAAIIEAPGHIVIREVNMPKPNSGEALIRVKAVGICGTDLDIFRGTHPRVSYPRIIGHEIAGEIISVNAPGSALLPGTRVVVEPYIPCGKCYPCTQGFTNCCENLQTVGVYKDGGLAEYFSHPVALLYQIPDALSWSQAALIEPLGIAYYAVAEAGIGKGNWVIITGAGPIGNLIAQVTISKGAIPILIDPLTERLRAAQDVGVCYLCSSQGEELVRYVSSVTRGAMADALIEASGSEQILTLATSLVKTRGKIIVVGRPKSNVVIPRDSLIAMISKEITIQGLRNCRGREVFQRVLQLVEHNKVNLNAIITDMIAIEDIPHVINELCTNPREHLKGVVLF